MLEDRRVILAIILGVSALLAAWAAFWWSSALLGARTNRASRIASIICPFPIAAGLWWAVGPLLDANEIDIEGLMNWHLRGFTVIFFACAIVLLIPTVLIAMLAGQMTNKRTPTND
jgi:ammonia channel protein AmtB